MATNAIKMTDYLYEAEQYDGEKYITFFDLRDELFYELTSIYAFDDLNTGMRITKISCEGMHCHYIGWQPNMVIEFANENGDIIYGGQYPQWNH